MCVLKRSYGQMVADGLVPGRLPSHDEVPITTADRRRAAPVVRAVAPVIVEGGRARPVEVAATPVRLGADPGR